jgi:DNA-directed RNA polymerase specialized sigma subunit
MNRLLEIPVFQTSEQFNGIISKTISPDEVIIDLYSEKGRNMVAKKYEKLCYKIALSFNGKSNIQFEDLLAIAYEGLTWAMNSYGKKSKKAMKREEMTGEELDIQKYKTTTFLTFASYYIRFAILEAIKNEAHLVRIPVNKQAEERKEKGYNTKTTEISGDKSIGNGDKGEKSLFDFIGGMENAGKSVDDEDISMVWKILMKKIKSSGKFSEKMINAWIQFNQLDGTEKKKNKDIAEELGISPANVTYYCYCINSFIKNDKEASTAAKELISLYNESLQRYYEENDKDEPVYVQLNENYFNEE